MTIPRMYSTGNSPFLQVAICVCKIYKTKTSFETVALVPFQTCTVRIVTIKSVVF